MEELTAKTIEKIENLVKRANRAENEVVVVDGMSYWVKDHQPIIEDYRPETIYVSSLSAIANYIQENREGFKKDQIFIHVASPTLVDLYEITSGEMEQRTHIMHATLSNDCAPFPFDQFLSTEEFIIGLMTRFISSEDQETTLKIAASLKSVKSLENSDDGATTKYDAHHGVVCTAPDIKHIPQVVSLYPFRTFRQIDQPGSSFVFRYRATGTEITCALIEADGGAWKHEAMDYIETYFRARLPEVQIIA